MSPNSIARSSLEEMLEALQQSEENEKNHKPPVLPARPKPTTRARLPSPKRRLPTSSGIGECNTAQISLHCDEKGEDTKLSKIDELECDTVPISSHCNKKKEYSKGSKFDELERIPSSSNGELREGGSKRLKSLGSKSVLEVESGESPNLIGPLDQMGHELQLDEGENVNNAKSPSRCLPTSRVSKGFVNIESLIQKKLRVWCRVHNSLWEPGQIQSASGDNASILLADGRAITVSSLELLPVNPELLDGVGDLMQLSYLNDPSILHNLQHRYFQDNVYSKAGPLLLALNPFKDVQLYGSDFAMVYQKQLLDSPHVYAVADAAYNKMMTDDAHQSIIISGESGAGKTETAKIAMQYLVLVGGSGGMESEVLQTSCILEAFGNAKTERNNNSSRFGQLIEIQFSATGEMCGAKLQAFQLEKSRVVQLVQGERSFHIFYQLCAGAPSDLQDRLRLKRACEYSYLNQSNCLEIHGVNDAKRFHMLMGALNTLKICKDDQMDAFEMLAAVLWLGNISFDVIDNENHIEAVVDEAVANAAALIGCDTQNLVVALSMHGIVAGKDKDAKRLTLEQAIDRRDSIAQFIYASLFDWLIEKINESLTRDKQNTGRSIGILDVYGFESFKKNSFEQMCINYANERLQQHFIRHLFKLPQEDYDLDGIDFTGIDFQDNQDCLDLFEKEPDGLISLLDEESKFPQATYLTLTSKFKQWLGANHCFKGEQGGFRVRHYAGEVLYDTDGFLTKNRDLLHSENLQLLLSCTSQMLQLFVSKLKESQKPTGSFLHVGIPSNRKPSVATKFKDQVFKIMQQLESTTPHFICCIRPNSKQLPGEFEKDLVLQQLRCCGVVEAVKISKSGYPIRLTHEEFTRKYRFLIPGNNECQDPLSTPIAILQKFDIRPEMYQIGFTKLFLRAGQIDALEKVRAQILHGSLVVEECFHGSASQNFHELEKGIVTMQTLIRGWLAHRRFSCLRQPNHSNVSEQKPSSQIFETEDQPPEMLSVIEELRKQVSMAEVGLGSKEKENAALRKQVQRLEMRWSEFESKMKSKGEMWRNEAESSQWSLDAARMSQSTESPSQHAKPHGTLASFFIDSEDRSLVPQTPSGIIPARHLDNSIDEVASGDANSSSNHVGSLVKEFEQRMQSFDEESQLIVELKTEEAPSADQVAELRTLKHRFEAWSKDFKTRLRQAKVKAQRTGSIDQRKSSWKWWGKKK